MLKLIQPMSHGQRPRVAIVRSRFNDDITRRLLDGAVQGLREAGWPDDRILLVEVPGAFEVPAAGAALLARDDVAAAIGIGCVIRGETTHFEHVSAAAAEGILRTGLDLKKPFIFGVLTVENEEQALARTPAGPANKGFEAAAAAVEMIGLLEAIRRIDA